MDVTLWFGLSDVTRLEASLSLSESVDRSLVAMFLASHSLFLFLFRVWQIDMGALQHLLRLLCKGNRKDEVREGRTRDNEHTHTHIQTQTHSCLMTE